METKAKYVFVGLCSLLGIAVMCGLLMFSMKHGGKNQLAYYAIEFSGGVAGLSIGNDVRFNGIKVGEVHDFTINPNDPSRVRVLISVDDDTPVREDSEASLTVRGVTGLAVVDITGGSASSPQLPKIKDQDGKLPVIKSRLSILSSMIGEAPNLINAANELLNRSSALLSPENQASVTKILNSLAAVAESLERQNQNLEAAIENLSKAGVTLNKVLESADRVIGRDLDQGVAYFSDAFKRFDLLIQELEPGAKRLTGGTADEMMRTLSEVQTLLRSVDLMVKNLNSDPQRFLFGDRVPGLQLK